MPDTIGPYEILGELGRGGMGVVFRARDARLGRDCAIKALPEDLATDPGRLERFEREARALAQISHPNTAGIYGVEESGDTRYLVLELVEGESLADRLDRGPLPFDEAIEIATQIAAGMEAAHEAGVIHRDLKPANIMITPEGQAKVLDFGLARSDDGQSSTGSSEDITVTTPVQQTTPGMVLGTAAYMSPEQARGRRVDKRTDIWSFGVVLYEMLAGASPFVGETATDSIGAVLHKDPELARLATTTPPGVLRVLARCLERDRNLRYRDIGDVRIELLRAADEPAAPAPAPDKRSAVPLVAVAAIIAALAAGAAWFFKPAPPPPQEIRLSAAGPDNSALLEAWTTPNGQHLIFDNRTLGDDPVFSLFVRPIDSHELTEIEASRRSRYYYWSPDSKWISYAAPVADGSTEYQLYRQPIDLSQPPTPVAVLPESIAISFYRYVWLSQDKFLFDDSRTNQVRFIDAATGRIGEPFQIDIGDYPGRYGSLVMRLDDTRAFCRLGRSGEGGGIDIAILDTQTATATVILENTNLAQLAPDGSLLFTRGSILYGCTFDAETLEVGPPVQLVAGLRSTGDDANFSIADNGMLVFRPGGETARDRGIEIFAEGGARTPLDIRPNAYFEQVALSPDNSFLVTMAQSQDRNGEIWGTELERPRMRRLRGVPGNDLNYPFVGPDNDTLVYLRAVEGRASVEVASIDDRFEPRQLVPPVEEGFIAPISFHPDGNRVLLLWESPDGYRLYEVGIDGEPPLRQFVPGDANVAWSDYSPDGTMLAYTSDETGQREGYVRTIRDDGTLGRAVPVTRRGVRAVQWRADPSPLATGAAHAPGPAQLVAYQQNNIELYPVTPGDRPSVGEPIEFDFEARDVTTGFGELLPDNTYLSITRGPSEAPATRAQVILNWYDQAAERIRRGE